MNKILSFATLVVVSNLMGCSVSKPAPVEERSRAEYPAADVYRVGTGDTLYSVAWAFQVDDQDLIEWNHLTPPYALHFGQTLRVKPPRGQAAREVRVITPAKPSAEPEVPIPHGGPHQWQWPAKGRLLSGFTKGAFAEKGIRIAGTLKAPVRAALPGVVVYSGAGVRGYGNLILIKHAQNFMSAYAFNLRNFVKDGDKVEAGQTIAEMGQDNSGRVLLYFEIRRYGKPVDPLPYLRN